MKLNNNTFFTQQHDDSDVAATTASTSFANQTLHCQEFSLALGAEQTLATITLTCLQSCVIEAFGSMVGLMEKIGTLRLYIDGTLVAYIDTLAVADVHLYTVSGYLAVNSGSRIISLKFYHRGTTTNQIDIEAAVFASCIKT